MESNTVTLSPRPARRSAAINPAGPAPMIAMSVDISEAPGIAAN
jgi:hypothetical protein